MNDTRHELLLIFRINRNVKMWLIDNVPNHPEVQKWTYIISSKYIRDQSNALQSMQIGYSFMLYARVFRFFIPVSNCDQIKGGTFVTHNMKNNLNWVF